MPQVDVSTQVRQEDLIDAVNFLVLSPDAQTAYNSMLAIANLAKVHPVALTGTAAVLNPLLHLRLSDEEAYDRVLALVEGKRRAAGAAPLERPATDRFDKIEYMREFMDAKRQRQRRAAEIENMLRSEPDKLIGRARLDFMDGQSAKWKQELDARLEKAREMKGGRLPRAQVEAIRAAFWRSVDDRLDTLEEFARKEQLKPPHLRQRAP
jgi:hypothetical protein